MSTEVQRTLDGSRYSAHAGINAQRGTEYRASASGSTPKAMYQRSSGIRPVVETFSFSTDGSAIARPRIRVGATIAWNGILPVSTATFTHNFSPPIIGITGASVVGELSTGVGSVTILGYTERVLS